MGFDECYLLGKILKTHGLAGELVAHLDVDDPTQYQELESVFVDLNGKLVPFFIESLAIRGDKAYLAIEDIESRDEAATLTGCPLYLTLDNLPKLLDGQYYYHELVGLPIYDQDHLLGTVQNVIELTGNNLLSVDHQGQEVLIPLEDEIVQRVDLTERKIYAILPEGLLDIYLSDEP
ncbi:ribosome maturation factor RimM [Marinoscillum sp. MHG1-6]|uniref:ribosome maturation factor RimM n=1 Tax=Marinoscillum sp. MHG1-6 TaxID=2959627 RepID=UPI00215886DE|nr:ribosome maturation factor RimM [Marinoscillum sp. MHG1-6]